MYNVMHLINHKYDNFLLILLFFFVHKIIVSHICLPASGGVNLGLAIALPVVFGLILAVVVTVIVILLVVFFKQRRKIKVHREIERERLKHLICGA